MYDLLFVLAERERKRLANKKKDTRTRFVLTNITSYANLPPSALSLSLSGRWGGTIFWAMRMCQCTVKCFTLSLSPAQFSWMSIRSRSLSLSLSLCSSWLQGDSRCNASELIMDGSDCWMHLYLLLLISVEEMREKKECIYKEKEVPWIATI